MFLKRLRLSSLHRLFSSPSSERFLSRSVSLPMAPNRQEEAAESESLESSPSEVEDVDGEEEEETESEDEDTPKPFFSKKVEIAEKSSESLISGEDAEDEEDEGASEEEEDDEAPSPIGTENTPSAAPPAQSKASPKRAASKIENVGDKDDGAKRAKKNGGEETKKSTFTRVFSADDETVILEGLVEYRAKTGVDPGSNMNGFRDFINQSLPFEATKIQLYEKIRRFRKRYENNAKKGRSTFSTTHEKKLFELSKAIWGTVEANDIVAFPLNSKVGDAKTKSMNKEIGEVGGDAKTKGINNEIGNTKAGVSPLDACLMNGNMSAEELVLKYGLDIVEEPKRTELQEKWKQYRVEEMKLHLKRLEFLTEQGNLVLKSLESTE